MFEIFDKQFSENSYFSGGVVPWRADNIGTSRTYGIASHNRSERTRDYIFLNKPTGKHTDAKTSNGGCDQRYTTIGFEAPLRANRDDPVAIHELPSFGALHQGLMGKELFWCLRCPVRFDVVWTRNNRAINGSYTPC